MRRMRLRKPKDTPPKLDPVPCPRYDPHPAHDRAYIQEGTFCPGLTEMQIHPFDARANFEGDYVRCCGEAAFDKIHERVGSSRLAP
jgi:hypothetical protein